MQRNARFAVAAAKSAAETHEDDDWETDADFVVRRSHTRAAPSLLFICFLSLFFQNAAVV